MYDEVLVCLDGSRFAERMIPYARGIAKAAGAELTFFRVIDYGEDFSAAERYIQVWTEHVTARKIIVAVKDDVPATILRELKRKPNALPAVTTHGHTGIWEPLLGSVALGVIRGAGRPVLLYHPESARGAPSSDEEFKVASVAAALAGSEFSEKILPFAAETARSLRVKLELIQALPIRGRAGQIPAALKRDVLEDSYLRRCARQVGKKYGVKVDWDVLHGRPAKAISAHVRGRPDVILAMTSRARSAPKHAIFGSVAAECVRHAGVPMLVYRPGA